MRTKKLISIIISAVMMLSVMIVTCACSPKEHIILTYKEAYDNGYINLDDWKNIVDYCSINIKMLYHKDSYISDADYRDDYEKLPKIKEDELQIIRKVVSDEYKDYFDYVSERDNVEKKEIFDSYLTFGYCGEYNGNFAFLLKINEQYGNTSNNSLNIEGITIDMWHYGMIYICCSQ